MDSSLLMLSVVNGQFHIWFFCIDSFKVFAEVHPTSCCIIITSSAPLTSRM